MASENEMLWIIKLDFSQAENAARQYIERLSAQAQAIARNEKLSPNEKQAAMRSLGQQADFMMQQNIANTRASLPANATAAEREYNEGLRQAALNAQKAGAVLLDTAISGQMLDKTIKKKEAELLKTGKTPRGTSQTINNAQLIDQKMGVLRDQITDEKPLNAAKNAKLEEASLRKKLLSDPEYQEATLEAAKLMQAQAAKLRQKLVADDQYLKDSAVVAAAKRREAASVQKELSGSRGSLRDAARLEYDAQIERADVQRALSRTPSYAQNIATERMGVSATEARTMQMLNPNTPGLEDEQRAAAQEYIQSQATVASQNLQQAALVREILVGDREYLDAAKSAAASKRREAAEVQKYLSGNRGALRDAARLEYDAQVERADVQRSLSRTKGYAQNIATERMGVSATEARTMQMLNPNTPGLNAEQVAAAQEYIQSQATVASENAQQAALIQEILVGDRRYLDAKVSTAQSLALEKAEITEDLARTRQYGESLARATISKQEIAAIEAEEIAASDAYVTSTVKLTMSQLEQAAKLDTALVAEPGYGSQYAATQIANQRRVAAEQIAMQRRMLAGARGQDSEASDVLRQQATSQMNATQMAADAQLRLNQVIVQAYGSLERYAAAMTEGAMAEKVRTQFVKTETARRTALNDQLNTAIGEEIAFKRIAKARQELVANAYLMEANIARPTSGPLSQLPGTGDIRGVDVEGVSAAQKQVLDAERVAVTNQALLRDQQELDALARRRFTQEQLDQELNRRLAIMRTEAAANGGSGALTGGTWFQRVQARIASRSGQPPRLPTEFQTGGQFLQSKFMTTAGFAVSGAAFYGVYQGIRNVLEEGNKLQTQFALIKEQLNQIGAGNQFDAIRTSILNVSKESGIAANEIAFLALQLRGAFSQEIEAKGIGYLDKQLESAGKIARVTGLPLKEVTDSLTGLSKTFDISLADIGDKTVGLQQRFGVLAKETIQFAADVGPAAKEAGLSFRELGAIGAAAQQLSGRSGSSIAEALGRILPTIQENAGQIVSVFESIGDASLTSKVITEINGGQTGEVLLDIIRNYDKLSRAQKNVITEALGGRREAQTLNAIFGNADQILREIGRGPKSDRNKLDKQFKALQATVSQTFAQLKQAAIQLGVSLYQSGIAQALTAIAKAMLEVFKAISLILGPFTQLIGLTDKLGGTLGGVANLGLLAGGVFAFRGMRAGPGESRTGGFVPMISGAYQRTGSYLSRLNVDTRGVGINPTTLQPQPGQRTFGTVIGSPMARQAAGYGAGGALMAAGMATNNQYAMGAGSGIMLASAGYPILGLVVAASTIIGGLLEAAKKAKEEEETLREEYKGLTDEKLSKLAKKDTGKTVFPNNFFGRAGGGFWGALGVVDPAYGTDEQFAALDEQDRRRLVKTRDLYKLQFRQSKGDTVTRQRLRASFEKAAAKAYKDSVISDYLNDRGGAKTEFEFLSLDDQSTAELAKKARDKAKGDKGFKADIYTEALSKIQTKIKNGLLSGIEFIDDLQKAQESKALAGSFKGTDAKLSTAAVDDLKKGYDAGIVSYQEYKKAMENNLRIATIAIQQAKAKGQDVNPVFWQMFFQSSQGISDLISKNVKERVDLIRMIRGYQGQPVGQEDLNEIVAAINTPNVNRETRQDLLKQGLDALQQKLQSEIDALGTAAEKQAREAEGIVLASTAEGQALERENVSSQVENALAKTDAAKGAIESLSVAIGNEDLLGIYNEVADKIINLGLSIGDAWELVVRQKLDEAREQLRIMGIAASFGGAGILDPAKVAELEQQVASFDELLNGSILEPLRASRARLIGTIRTGGNYADSAADDNAAEELRSARDAYVKALYGLAKAQTANNPVMQAQYEIALANVAEEYARASLELAKNEAEELQAQAAILDAMAQRVQAEQSLRDAMYDIFKAQRNVVMAIAEAAGDAVKVAELELQALKEDLFRAGIENQGDAVMTDLQAQIISAEANLRDATLQAQEETIAFNLETEQISKQQALAMYQSLLDNADIMGYTVDEKRDLIRRIRDLRNQLDQDLQFNLPTTLRLPTLYEARRLNQMEASGSSYQDNRTYEITLNTSGSLDGQAAVDQIVNEINAPSVYGSYTRRY